MSMLTTMTASTTTTTTTSSSASSSEPAVTHVTATTPSLIPPAAAIDSQTVVVPADPLAALVARFLGEERQSVENMVAALRAHQQARCVIEPSTPLATRLLQAIDDINGPTTSTSTAAERSCRWRLLAARLFLGIKYQAWDEPGVDRAMERMQRQQDDESSRAGAGAAAPVVSLSTMLLECPGLADCDSRHKLDHSLISLNLPLMSEAQQHAEDAIRQQHPAAVELVQLQTPGIQDKEDLSAEQKSAVMQKTASVLSKGALLELSDYGLFSLPDVLAMVRLRFEHDPSVRRKESAEELKPEIQRLISELCCLSPAMISRAEFAAAHGVVLEAQHGEYCEAQMEARRCTHDRVIHATGADMAAVVRVAVLKEFFKTSKEKESLLSPQDKERVDAWVRACRLVLGRRYAVWTADAIPPPKGHTTTPEEGVRALLKQKNFREQVKACLEPAVADALVCDDHDLEKEAFSAAVAILKKQGQPVRGVGTMAAVPIAHALTLKLSLEYGIWSLSDLVPIAREWHRLNPACQPHRPLSEELVSAFIMALCEPLSDYTSRARAVATLPAVLRTK